MSSTSHCLGLSGLCTVMVQKVKPFEHMVLIDSVCATT